ncbi:hypothetical protein JKP88DRAFT_243743 [Tribonema minus]|uniref:Uncharacterized protein n=1 Tax=Tribonema minus TaxID=303371 RepID=A0A835Z6R9_9STRA|nr:hypothetical protein JKP88DRAFT_243743 [Tribonema minus]
MARLHFLLLLLVAAQCCGEHLRGQKFARRMPAEAPICMPQTAICEADPRCADCLREGTFPPKPVALKTCAQLQRWILGITFPPNGLCDVINGGQEISQLVYCQ